MQCDEGSAILEDPSSLGRTAAPRGEKAEVVVVGGGPAGIAAAVHAAEAGARTLLLDEQRSPGGQIWRHRGEAPPAARAWLERLARSGATWLDRATVVDAPVTGDLLVERDGRPVRVGFERLVLATGARELFLPFPGWTLPGVVGAGGAQALLKAGARFDGLRVVVAGSGPLLPAVAAALARAGARVVGLAEQAPLARLAAFGAGLWREPGKLAEALGYAARLAGVLYRTGAWVREAEGREAVERAIVTDGRREWRWECDVLACAFGLVPSLELPRLLGCDTVADAVLVDASQRTSVDRVFAAGELGGIAGVDRALTTGAIAGLAAAGRPVPPALARRRERESGFAARLLRSFALRDELKSLARPDTVVCRCEDVPLGRLAAAASPREAKLHTRAGMGPCQGRVCGAALSVLRGFPPDSVRPPLSPVPIEVLEGD
jgi:NADPH-dependent 2,4-dienoyl-CoA reductase/sulfur reductase-like enzyme